MNMNEIYEAPAVELIKVSVERGFEVSQVDPNDPDFGGGLEDPFA